MTECLALAKSKEGKDREPFNVRSEPKPAVYSSWDMEGIGGHLSVRPDDRWDQGVETAGIVPSGGGEEEVSVALPSIAVHVNRWLK